MLVASWCHLTTQPWAGNGHGAAVTRVGVAQVGDGRFFVTVECERRDGVAAPLCAAVESLACFRVEISSLVPSGPDRVVSTLTLKVLLLHTHFRSITKD